MTIPVSLEELPAKARELGRFAFVITSAGATSPRVTHVEVTFVEHEGSIVIQTELGKSACRELVQNPHVTVLWPAKDDSAAGAALSLIVDGRVNEPSPTERGGNVVRIVPTSAILHQKRTISL